MKSHRLRLRKYDVPVRFRPVSIIIRPSASQQLITVLQWFLILTCIIVVVLAFLGFTNFKDALPINDKILHFLCFCFATFVFYFIVDMDEYVLSYALILAN